MTGPRFATGQAVRIVQRAEPAHHRVPAYAQGVTGHIERVCGEHGRPEAFIRGDGAPRTRLYRVRIPQLSLWPAYSGSPEDCLDIEVFEHWLEPVS